MAFGFAWNQGGFRAVELEGPPVHEVGADSPGGLGATFASLGLPSFALDLRTAPRGAVKAWLAAPHRAREIGAIYTSAPHMDGVFSLSACYDAILFIHRTTASRSL